VLFDHAHTQRSFLPARTQQLRLGGRLFSAEVTVGENLAHFFAGRTVLMTQQRDNELRWITDWIQFHQRWQGVDAVLLYDNGSTKYATEELHAAIVAVCPQSCIVRWPFKHGPSAGKSRKWDSAFSQTSALEHARFRFLTKAAFVIHADVDELLVPEAGRSIAGELAQKGSGGVRYHGRWIEATEVLPASRHRDHVLFDPSAPQCSTKWTVIPRAVPEKAIWGVHDFRGWWPPVLAGVRYRHFRVISTDWKHARSTAVKPESDLSTDWPLVRAFQ
jgi:hypothetical protein